MFGWEDPRNKMPFCHSLFWDHANTVTYSSDVNLDHLADMVFIGLPYLGPGRAEGSWHKGGVALGR